MASIEELTITLMANLIEGVKVACYKQPVWEGSPLDFPVLVNGTIIYPVSQDRKDSVVIFSLSFFLKSLLQSSPYSIRSTF